MLLAQSGDQAADPEKYKNSGKKTVASMIINDSCGIDGLDGQALRQIISESPILEPDRKAYLLDELPKSQIEKLEFTTENVDVLESPKTLIFFLGPHVHQGLAGTLVVIVQSLARLVHPIFLSREIIKTTQSGAGVFSFQFGPVNRSLELATSSTLHAAKPEATSDNKTASSRESEVPSITPTHTDSRDSVTHSDQFSIHKNALLTSKSISTIHSVEKTMGWSLVEDEDAHDLGALRSALISHARIFINAERARLKAMKTHYQTQIDLLKSENKSLRKEVQLLSKRNVSIRKKPGTIPGGDSHVEIFIPPPSDVTLPKHHHPPRENSLKSKASQGETPLLSCLWKNCEHRAVPSDLLWSHVVQVHIKAQSDGEIRDDMP